MSTSSRLLRLLALLQTPRDWTGTQLADRLAVTTRTIRNDVERLRTLGYPVEGLPGPSGGYRLRPGAQLPPLLLDDDEAVAIALGLQAMASGAVTGVEETALRALTKIASLLPPRLRRRVQTVQQSSVVLPVRGPRVDASALQSIAGSIRDHEGLRFDYVAADGTTSRRRVEPEQLVHRAGRWYVVGFDLDRDDWRSFRVDRLRLRIPGGPRFVPREVPGGDAGAFLASAVTALAHQVSATVRLHAPAVEVTTWMHPAWGRIEPVDDRRCLFHLERESLDAVVLHLLLADLDFDVVSPPELLDRVGALAARLDRAHGAGLG